MSFENRALTIDQIKILNQEITNKKAPDGLIKVLGDQELKLFDLRTYKHQSYIKKLDQTDGEKVNLSLKDLMLQFQMAIYNQMPLAEEESRYLDWSLQLASYSDRLGFVMEEVAMDSKETASAIRSWVEATLEEKKPRTNKPTVTSMSLMSMALRDVCITRAELETAFRNSPSRFQSKVEVLIIDFLGKMAKLQKSSPQPSLMPFANQDLIDSHCSVSLEEVEALNQAVIGEIAKWLKEGCLHRRELLNLNFPEEKICIAQSAFIQYLLHAACYEAKVPIITKGELKK